MNKRVFIAVLAACLAGGCATQIEAPVVKPWEGRYDTEKNAREAVSKIKLERGESVWLLSNKTLKRLIKTTKE